jgi:hypothetical protein
MEGKEYQKTYPQALTYCGENIRREQNMPHRFPLLPNTPLQWGESTMTMISTNRFNGLCRRGTVETVPAPYYYQSSSH